MKLKSVTISGILYFAFFFSLGLLLYSEEPIPEKLIAGQKSPYREEINLSKIDYDYDLPVLTNNKEPVTQSFSFQKFSLILNSNDYHRFDYKKYFFVFSSYLRSKHFFLGEHSSLRAPPFTRHTF